MPIYTLNDLKRSSGKVEYRSLELPINKNKKIWIPSLQFLYHRTHFNVKMFFPKSRFTVLDCSNQNLGQNGKGCPICELKESFWAEWKKADKDQKKNIQEKINKIVSEEIWFNCIDIEDPDKMFQAVRFTMPKGKDLLNSVEASESKDISNIIWYYKKLQKDEKIEYSIQDIDSPELVKLAHELKESLPMFMSRDYAHGGPVDLESSIIRVRTAQSIKDVISGNDSSSHEDEEDVESNVSAKKTSTPTVEIDETDSISLDDLDGKKDELSESLEMDGLDLDPVDPPPVKYVQITSELFAEKVKGKDVSFLKTMVEFAVKEKLIKDEGSLNANVKNLYNCIKTSKDFPVPESVFNQGK